MARPSNRSQRQKSTSSVIPEGMISRKIELEFKEDRAEPNLRLWQAKYSFVVNDVLTTIIALGVLITLVVVSTVILFRSTLPDDRHFATSTLTAVGTAVVGYALGKSQKTP